MSDGFKAWLDKAGKSIKTAFEPKNKLFDAEDFHRAQLWSKYSPEHQAEIMQLVSEVQPDLDFNAIERVRINWFKARNLLQGASYDKFNATSFSNSQEEQMKQSSTDFLKLKVWKSGDPRKNKEPWTLPNSETMRFTADFMILKFTLQVETKEIRTSEPNTQKFIQYRTRVDETQGDNVHCALWVQTLRKTEEGVMSEVEGIYADTMPLMDSAMLYLISCISKALARNAAKEQEVDSENSSIES